MVYVFEGARNSGKTYLSNYISEFFKIPRFQFDFGSHFNLLNLQSKNNRESHSFSMGKELMLMQLSRDIDLNTLIHDRGILTVLSWGLSENRISRSDVIDQIKYIKDQRLLNNITIIYISGDNPNKSDRNKDQWDYADKDNLERDAFDFVVSKFEEFNTGKIYKFTNTFTQDSLLNIKSTFENIIY